MKLYFAPGTCALAPIILAEWLGVGLELKRVNHRDPSDEYLAINPLGAVPALQLDDGTVATQVDAILQYLAGDSELAGGQTDEELLQFHRWVAFLTGDYHPPFGGWFNPGRFTTDHSEEALAAVKAGLELRIRRVVDVLEGQVSGDGHIALGRRTLLDAYAYAMLRWLRLLDGGLEPWPKLANFLALMEDDEGVQRALAREKRG
jgi:glutathione S-transferase